MFFAVLLYGLCGGFWCEKSIVIHLVISEQSNMHTLVFRIASAVDTWVTSFSLPTHYFPGILCICLYTFLFFSIPLLLSASCEGTWGAEHAESLRWLGEAETSPPYLNPSGKLNLLCMHKEQTSCEEVLPMYFLQKTPGRSGLPV